MFTTQDNQIIEYNNLDRRDVADVKNTSGVNVPLVYRHIFSLRRNANNRLINNRGGYLM